MSISQFLNQTFIQNLDSLNFTLLALFPLDGIILASRNLSGSNQFFYLDLAVHDYVVISASEEPIVVWTAVDTCTCVWVWTASDSSVLSWTYRN